MGKNSIKYVIFPITNTNFLVEWNNNMTGGKLNKGKHFNSVSKKSVAYVTPINPQAKCNFAVSSNRLEKSTE
jgi:hypothetical protein